MLTIFCLVFGVLCFGMLLASGRNLGNAGELLKKVNTNLFETRSIIDEFNTKYPGHKFLVAYTGTVRLYGNATITTVRNALAFTTEREVLEFSRKAWLQGFDTTWFAWNGGITRELTSEEFKAIEESVPEVEAAY